MCVAEAGDGTLIVTDNGNNRVKAVLTSGVVTNLYGVTHKYWGGTYPGWYDGTVYMFPTPSRQMFKAACLLAWCWHLTARFTPRKTITTSSAMLQEPVSSRRRRLHLRRRRA